MKIKKLLVLSIAFTTTIVIACRKGELINNAQDGRPEQLEKNKDFGYKSPSGDCWTNYYNTLDQYNYDYGINGPKYNPNDLYPRDSAFYALSIQYLKCKYGPSIPQQTIPVSGPRPTRVNQYSAFLQLFGFDSGNMNLCDLGYISEYKSKVAPLNAIIKRTVDDVGTLLYYNATQPQRLAMLYDHIDMSEIAMFYNYIHSEPSFAFHYFECASSLSIVPREVAVKLFDKPDGLPPVLTDIYGNPIGPPVDFEEWNGFIIDHRPASNVLNDYCNSGTPTAPTIVLLPNPQPTGIYYQANYNLLGQFIPHLYTSIFLNPIDNKYYTDSSLTNYVPDGYYDSPTEVVGNNHRYYHIVNGVVAGILNIVVDPSGPTGPIGS